MFGDVDRHGTSNWPFQVPGGYLSTFPGNGPTAMAASAPPSVSPSLSSGQYSAAASVGGNANVSVAVLVGLSLLILLGTHLLGFRFGFDVSVGR